MNPTQRRELAFLLVTAMLVATMAVLAGRFDLVSGKRSELLYDKTYAGGQSWGPMDRADGAWQLTSRGLAVEPGRSGTLTIRVANDVESQLIALVFGRAGTEAAILLEVSTDGQRFRVASERPALDGTRIDLSRWSGAGEQVWVRITASAATAPVEVARVRLVRLKRPLTFPNLPIAALMILAPVLAYVARSRTRRSGAMSYGLLVLGAMSMLTEAIASTRVPDSQQQWWELVVVSQTRDGYYLAPYGILLLLGGWQAKVWLPGSVDARLWGAFALGGILAWGGSSRLAAFSEMGGSQLGPDAMTYMHLAQSLQNAYDTMYREPLWVWMIKVWFAAVGATAAHQRVLTVLLSLAVIWAAYRLFADYTDRPLVGVLAAAALAGNEYLIRLSAQGLREEAYLLAVLSIVYLVFVKTSLSPFRQACWLGVAGAGAHLLRFNSYLFVIPLLLLWAWRLGRGRRWLALVPAALIVMVSVPHVVHNQRQYGDPLYSVNVHFVWSRNYEFVLLKQTGCTGCPTREEVEADSTSGPTLNAWQYLFELHGGQEVIIRTLQGYRDLYMRPGELFTIQSGTASHWGFGLYLLGMVLVLIGPYREMIGVVLLLANGVPFAVTLGIDPRIAIHTAPFVAFILAYGLARPIETAAKVLEHGKRFPLPTLSPRGRSGQSEGGADLKSWSRL